MHNLSIKRGWVSWTILFPGFKSILLNIRRTVWCVVMSFSIFSHAIYKILNKNRMAEKKVQIIENLPKVLLISVKNQRSQKIGSALEIIWYLLNFIEFSGRFICLTVHYIVFLKILSSFLTDCYLLWIFVTDLFLIRTSGDQWYTHSHCFITK